MNLIHLNGEKRIIVPKIAKKIAKSNRESKIINFFRYTRYQEIHDFNP